jgi:hypothetical protein
VGFGAGAQWADGGGRGEGARCARRGDVTGGQQEGGVGRGTVVADDWLGLERLERPPTDMTGGTNASV